MVTVGTAGVGSQSRHSDGSQYTAVSEGKSPFATLTGRERKLWALGQLQNSLLMFQGGTTELKYCH